MDKALTSDDKTLSLKGKVSLLLATTLALLSTAIVSPSMPDIASTFAINMEQEWLPRTIISFISLFSESAGSGLIIKIFVLSVPALFIVIGAPIIGMLGDIWSKKWLLIISLAVFSVSGTSGYFVDSLTPLLIGRAVLGLSVAGIKACTVAMVGDYFSGEARHKYLGLQGASMKLGGVLFLLMGGYLADFSWRTPFLVYLIAFVALPGIILYLYDVNSCNDVKAAQEPIPWPRVGLVLITAFMASTFFFMILVQAPFFLDQAFSVSRFQMGLASAVANTIAGVVATVFFLFKARLSYLAMFAFVFLMIGTGFFIVSGAPAYWVVLVGLGVAGLGIGLIIPAQDSWMLATIPAEKRGLGTGLVATAMYLGQFMAPIVIDPFINPSDPFYVFTVASETLLALGVIYFFLASYTRLKVNNEAKAKAI